MKKQSLLAVFLGLIITCSPAVSSAQAFFYDEGYAPQQSCYKFSQTVRIGGVIHRQYGTRCEPVGGVCTSVLRRAWTAVLSTPTTVCAAASQLWVSG